MNTVLIQSLIVFVLLQVLFGFIAMQYRKDIFYAISELIKPKYLIPSIAITLIFTILNLILRGLITLFS